MNSQSFHRPFEPWRLYAAKGRQCAGENNSAADRIGVRCVVASDTEKYLSTAIQLVALSTLRAGRGTVRGRIGKRMNTVLLSLHRCPIQDSTIYPGCNGFTKCLTSLLVLAPLHVVQGLDAHDFHFAPRQEIERSVN